MRSRQSRPRLSTSGATDRASGGGSRGSSAEKLGARLATGLEDAAEAPSTLRRELELVGPLTGPVVLVGPRRARDGASPPDRMLVLEEPLLAQQFELVTSRN